MAAAPQNRKRVCIIGAGVSGLPAIKACLEEGLDVVCYERTADIGGLWNYRPNTKDGGSVMRSTVVNTSKEMMAYSDFPPPAEFPNFMHHSLVLRYIRMHVHYDDDGKGWVIELKESNTARFDYLMLCSGHHSIPQYPTGIKGMETFRGRVLHARDYQSYEGFEDRNVFIIGIGNSALDIAVELARVAKSVTVSTRRGSWIFNRVAQAGMPYDVLLMSRLYQWLMGALPWSIVNDFMEHRLQQRLDHDLYGLRPPHRFFQQHPTEDVEFVEEQRVTVKGGKSFPADVLILCTGYTFGFDYLSPPTLLPINDHRIDLYKFVFPPAESRPRLAVIGLIQPIGSLAPIAEMQSRWAAGIFAEMQADIDEKRSRMLRRYFKSSKHTFQVDYLNYMDELAERVGCSVPLLKELLHNPRFFLRLFVGGNVPYVYRLVGRNSWAQARNAIYTAPLRIKFPLKNRQCRIRRHKRRGTLVCDAGVAYGQHIINLVKDEYFRYASAKWIAGYTCLLLVSGLWLFCSGAFSLPAMGVFTYFTQVFTFLLLFSFILLWFDLQYDMSTIF